MAEKPNKQQANNAGNEIGIDLANAIGKAISRVLGSYDFTPVSKNIAKSIGSIDLSSALSLDDNKVKQLATTARASIEKEMLQLKIADVQALVTKVDTSLITDEIAKLNPLSLETKLQKPVEDLFGPVEINPTVGKIDYDPTELVQTIKKSFMNLNTTLSIIGSTLRTGIGPASFRPAIESTAIISKQATAIDDTFSGLIDNVGTLKAELKDSALVMNMLSRDADLYSEMNASTASTYATITKSSKEELVQAAQKLNITNAEKLSKQELVGVVGDMLVKLKEEKELNDNISSSYADMEKSMKQVEADLKLKNLMIKTGLTGEYAETARLKQLQLEQGTISKEEYATSLSKLKAEHHIYEEKAKQLELVESLADWQFKLKEELEDYEKGWEKLKSKIKAVVTDPQVLKSFLTVKGLESLKDNVKELKEQFGDFRKEGLTISQATHEMGVALGATFSFSGTSLKENGEIMAGIRDQMGSMHDITSDTVAEVGKMAKTFGLSAVEAGKLQGQFQNMPGATAESATNTLEFAGNLAKAAHVAPGEVMKSIAGSAEEVALYSKDGGKNIATAAVAAKKLGVEFSTLTKMSENLLNFESSINKQMEASVLLGREINLDKARQAALNGDLVGATQEMLANVGGEAEFNKMNMLQRKALADSMGVSVGELSKMVKHQDELKNLTEEQQMALATGEVTMDEVLANAGGVADRFKESALSVVGLVGGISTFRHGLKDSVGLLQDGVSGIKGMFAGFKEGTGVLGKVKEGAKGLVGVGKKTTEVATDLVSKTEVPTEGAEKMSATGEKVGKKGMTEGFKDNMKNIADGFKEMGQGGVAKGIFNTMIAGPALVIALPAIPFLLFMGKVGLDQLSPNFTNLASGLSAMSGTFAGSAALAVFGIAAIPSLLAIPFLSFMGLVPLAQLAINLSSLSEGLIAMSGTFVGSAALAAFGLAAAIAIPSLLFLGGVALLGAVGAAGLIALGGGLEVLGGVAATGLPFLAIGLIAALGIAMIPFAVALNIATPAIKAFGDIIIGVFQQIPPIIAAVSAGFVTIFNAMAQNWQILIPVGIGLMSVAAGLGALGFASLTAFPGLMLASVGIGMMIPGLTLLNMIGQTGALTQIGDSLAAISAAGGGLLAVGGALFTIAGGLGAIAGAGLFAMPVIGSLIALASVAPALSALAGSFGGGGEKGGSTTETKVVESSAKDEKMDILIEEIRALRSVLSKGGVINMDGKKVGDVLRLAMNTSGVR